MVSRGAALVIQHNALSHCILWGNKQMGGSTLAGGSLMGVVRLKMAKQHLHVLIEFTILGIPRVIRSSLNRDFMIHK